MIEEAACWERFHCTDKQCPAYGNKDVPCWLISKTHCRKTIQGTFSNKMEVCLACDFLTETLDLNSLKDTLIGIQKLYAEQLQERRRVETGLFESEKRLRSILSSIQAGVMIIDAESHVITDVNPTAVSMIGTAKENIIGHVCHKFICPSEKGKCPGIDCLSW